MAIGSVAVEVVPDTSNMVRKIRAATAEIRDIEINVDADTAAMQAKLLELTVQAKELDAAARGIKLDVDRNGIDRATGSVNKLYLALGLLSPALVPLGGAAVAAGGAIGTAMGVGALAVLGVKDAMKDGTATGLKFKDSISTLTTDFDALKATAADGVLIPFRDAVARLHEDMPEVNAAVADLSPLLGDAAGHLATGLVGGLKTFQPLMHDVLGDVDELSAKFESWATGPGGEQFADNLMHAYEEVKPLISDTADVLVKIVQVAAPLGSALVDAFDDAAKALKPLLDGIKWIEEHTPKGVGLGGGSAFGAINDLGQGRGSTNQLVVGSGATPSPAAAAATEQAKQLAAAQSDLAKSLGLTDAAAAKVAAGLHVDVAAAAAAAAATDKHTQSLAQATLQMQLQNDAAGLLRQGLDKLNGGTLNVVQADLAARDAKRAFLDVTDTQTHSLDTNTAAGSANTHQLISAITSMQDSAVAAQHSGTSSVEAARKYAQQVKAFEDSAVKAGYNKAEVDKLLTSLGAFKDLKLPPTQLDVKDLASAKLQAIVNEQARIERSITITVGTNYVGNPYAGGQAGLNRATGGFITGPGTGTSDSIPAMLSNGEFVVNAAATAQNRALLEALNSGADGVAAFATGGGAGAVKATAKPSTADLKAIAAHGEALLAALKDGMKKGYTGVETFAAGINKKLLVLIQHHAPKTVTDQIAKEANQILRLSEAHKQVAASLDAAKKKLDELHTARDKTATGISQAITSSFDLIQSANTGQGRLNSFWSFGGMQGGVIGQILADLRAKVDVAGKFNADIKALIAKGFDKGQVEKLALAGPQASSAAVQALLGASAAQVAEFNALVKNLTVTGNTAGDQVAGALYDASIKAADGFVKGLAKQQKSIEDQMLVVARKMAVEFARAVAAAQKAAAVKAGKPAAKHALGGWITGPGTGTSDSVPLWGSNGEFVTNAVSARRYAPQLEAINAGTYQPANTGPAGIAAGTTVNLTVVDQDGALLARMQGVVDGNAREYRLMGRR